MRGSAPGGTVCDMPALMKRGRIFLRGMCLLTTTPCMPRRPRVVIPGVAHHVTQRGNDRQDVFLSPADRRLYLELLAWHAGRSGSRILGYCLMTNHMHLIAVPEREQSLARTLGRTHSEFALAVNRANRRSGHVWQNRFFSCPMSESHLLAALKYVELNPVRATLVANAWDWHWSSARAHVAGASPDEVLYPGWEEHLGRWDYGEWREILAAGFQTVECEAVRRATLTGEPLGPPEFVAALERQVGKRLRVLERGRPKKGPDSASEQVAQDCLFAASFG